MSSIRVITLGCSKNSVDTEHLLALLPDGLEIRREDDPRPVDILCINTCGFIGDAKEESIQTILEAVESKRAGDVSCLIVFGCLSQRYAEELPAEIPEVDAWFGARELLPVASRIAEFAGLTLPETDDAARYRTDPSKPYAYLKISEGCDRRCSYCAIPLIRGAHRSVPIEKLEAEARTLAGSGVRELILIAQDSTYYGLDIYHRRALADLLRRLSAIEGIEWIRIHYSYPDGFPDDVLDEIASNPKICKYIDIPLQHIADPVLDAMHRHVDSAWTRSLVARMRDRVKGVVLRTTMIVGHPGEGEKEFSELLDFVREARFERLGVFCYSEEEGTWGAQNLVDDVPEATKRQRYDALMSLQRDVSLDFNRSRVGQVVRVLVDAYEDGCLICRSMYESPEVDGEILVSLDDATCGSGFVGGFVDVRIVAADEYDLAAELIS